MGGALQLAYPVRGRISYGVGLVVVLSLGFLLGFRSESRLEPRLMEFQADLAVLEAAPQPAVQEQPAPEPVKPAEHQPVPVQAPVVHAVTVPQPVPVVNTPLSTSSESADEAPTTLAAASPPPAVVGPGGAATAVESAAAAVKASARAAYEATLRAYLERIKRYPSSREARQTRPRGVVRVWLDLDRSGRLLDSGVLDTSGSNLLDGEALRTIRGGTYPSFSDHEYQGESRRRFTAALSYTIE